MSPVRCVYEMYVANHSVFSTGGYKQKAPHCVNFMGTRKKPRKQNVRSRKKKYPCPNCSETFEWNYTLRRHLRDECTEPCFKCPYCDYRGSWKSDVTRHIKRKHKNCKVHVLTTKF
ncbi:Longitudinals lacking protein, isoforms F/I/K/T [Harpegnathos saltator]|uniref:Longitudinals lacking protein, isoforms F/I/K/T n=1 Tax=Harpegnathos saltator TaxID=610380 RepID=E2BJA5_HARSA|nr:Longitudinals lacking protein, isoforms F/I/K/T [Harpegnathos saltator]